MCLPFILRLIAPLARCCLVWLLVVWQVQGLAQEAQTASSDHISARAWLDDPSNSLGPEQVRTMAWTPYQGPLRRGFLKSTTWLRLTIDPAATDGPQRTDWHRGLVLRIQPGQLDDIALFDPRFPDQAPKLAGDRHDWRLSEYRSFNQNLVIDAPRQTIEVLLRLRSTSHHGIHVQALDWNEVEAIDRLQQLIIGAVVMFLLMILLWAVIAWAESRERVIAAFIVHHGVSLLFALSLLGFFRVYLSNWLSAPTIEQLTSMLFPITTTAVIWFHWHFLREFTPPPLGMRCLKLLAATGPLTLVLMLAGLTRQSLQITSVIAFLYPALLLLLAWYTPQPALDDPPRLSRWSLIMIYVFLLIIMSSAALPALGLLPSPPWAMYSAIVYGLVSATLLASALRFRAIQTTGTRYKAEAALAQSVQLVSQEQVRRNEQDQFMTMLTHELTNALATAQLAIGSLVPASPMRERGYRAIDSMRSIIRRCAQSCQLEAKDSALQLAAVDLQALTHELCSQLPADVQIVLHTQAELPPCVSDRQLVGVILSNLLDNALKYRAKGSVIEVSVSAQPQGALPGLQLSVNNLPGDTGWPDPQQMFKKYWRGLGATRITGSGLGLYLSSLIAARLGGELRYQPEKSKVRFELWLPT
ncbi:MAG: hypothetical protein HQ446_12230 [Polaromonas sp.]|nr:hypothetical protein [Polaromonas sp.]